MNISIKPFGRRAGVSYNLYTITNARGASVSITDIGCAITRLCVPDRHGNIENITLGFDDVKHYAVNDGYLGALIGPVCNRIAGGRFTFRGEEYALERNENGKSLLHGGAEGYHDKLWAATCQVDANGAQIKFTREFTHKEGGHPGDYTMWVTYAFTQDSALIIDYDIIAQSPTFVSPTNHAYFNLGGTSAARIAGVERQYIQIFADKYTQIDADTISVKHAPVDGTPLDLRAPKLIGEGLKLEDSFEQLKLGFGYDHNYLLSEQIDPNTGVRYAARVYDEQTGREMRVYTDMPAIQFYSANHLKRYNPAEKCYYKKRQALCLETQFTPDSIHHPNEAGYQIAEVTPETPFHSRTIYAFSAFD